MIHPDNDPWRTIETALKRIAEQDAELVGYRMENDVLRSNCNHISSENAGLSRLVDSMAMRIESLAEELAKPEDVRLREVLTELDGRAVIFDSLASRVGAVLDDLDEYIDRAGSAERTVDSQKKLLVSAQNIERDLRQQIATLRAARTADDERDDVVAWQLDIARACDAEAESATTPIAFNNWQTRARDCRRRAAAIQDEAHVGAAKKEST